MRAVPVVLAGVLLAVPAFAQVTTNEGALDSLAAPHVSRPARSRPVRPPSHSAVATPPVAPAPAPAAKTVKPPISATPPAILALPPAVAVPLAHQPPPPPVPVTDDAPGTAVPIPDGIRITFGSDRADLNPATAAALTRFAGGVAPPNSAIHIFAYAAGSTEDPSTPRRLSLERALAARAALLKAGIPSPRIYPRALGPAGGEQPDRVDVVTGTSVPPAATPTAAGHPG